MKRYFVHYSFSNKNKNGFGMIQMTFEKGMDVIAAKKWIEENIFKVNGSTVIITNFIEFKKYETMGEL